MMTGTEECSRRVRGWPVWLALVLWSWCRPVHAGPVEQMVDVAFGVGTSSLTTVVRYENGGGGLIFGIMGKGGWRLQCGSSFLSPGETSRGPLVTLANGPMLIPTSRGVVSGRTDGCDYRLESPLSGAQVIDLQADPADAHFALGVFNQYGMTESSTSLLRRSASGDWSELSRVGNAVSTGLRATPHAGGVRIYQTVLVPVMDEDAGAAEPIYKLRFTDDDGHTFTERALHADGPARVIAVDPTNPERLVLLIEPEKGNQQIAVSPDAGATLHAYLSIEKLGGIAMAPDGRVWIGSRSDNNDAAGMGLWAAANLDTAPTRLDMADYPVQCLGYHALSDTLYACQHFWFGKVAQGSGAFDRVLSFTDVEDFVRCDGEAARCQQQLCAAYCGMQHFAVAPVCSAYDEPECGRPVALLEGGPDAGVVSQPSAAGGGGARAPAAGSGGGAAASSGAAASGCSCNAVGRPGGSPVTVTVTVTLLIGWRQRRRAVANTR